MKLERIKCTVCGSDSSKPLFDKFELCISKCSKCGLIYVNPRLPQSDTLKRYDSDYFRNEYLPSLGIVDDRYDLNFFDARYSYMLDIISKNVRTQGKNMLEIGVGAGFFLKSAERSGWQVTGTEISEPCFEFARNTLDLNVKYEKAEDLNSETNFFDVVVMFDVIEHLFNPFKVLQAVNNVLKENGLLVISTPNYNALSRIFLGLGWSIFSPVDHLYYFSETSITKLLNRASFKNNFFVRSSPAFGVYETTNPRSTHFPNSLRAKFYSVLVSSFGKRLMKSIQAIGLGDVLLCFTFADKEKMSQELTTEIAKLEAIK